MSALSVTSPEIPRLGPEIARPLRVAVLGATGHVGRLLVGEVLEAPDVELAAAVASPQSAYLGSDAADLVGRTQPSGITVTSVGPGCFHGATVVVDFSLPAGLSAALHVLEGRALVTGTTGLGADLQGRLDAQSEVGAVLQAANFSTGVNLLLGLVAQAAAALPDFDVELIEAHHRRKRDAPSGTAMALARAAAEARGHDLEAALVAGRSGMSEGRTPGSIGVQAIRGGTVAGEHQVWLAGAGEHLVLTHRAESRSTFAHGALRAARWLGGRPPGRYTMAQVLGLA